MAENDQTFELSIMSNCPQEIPMIEWTEPEVEYEVENDKDDDDKDYDPESEQNKSKTKRINLSLDQKVFIIQERDKGTRSAKLADMLNVNVRTINRVYGLREQIKEFTKGAALEFLRARKCAGQKNLLFESMLLEWFKQQQSQNLPTTYTVVKKQAEILANQLGDKKLKFSEHSYLWFKFRNGLDGTRPPMKKRRPTNNNNNGQKRRRITAGQTAADGGDGNQAEFEQQPLLNTYSIENGTVTFANNDIDGNSNTNNSEKRPKMDKWKRINITINDDEALISITRLMEYARYQEFPSVEIDWLKRIRKRIITSICQSEVD